MKTEESKQAGHGEGLAPAGPSGTADGRASWAAMHMSSPVGVRRKRGSSPQGPPATQQQAVQQLHDQPRSGSYSTPADASASVSDAERTQANAEADPQHQQHCSQRLAMLSAQQLLLLQEQAETRPKRNARQQEQNKMAQQRYRAKRKAQFEELQSKVDTLQAELDASKKEQEEAERLRNEVALLRSKLSGSDAGGAAHATAAAAAPPPAALASSLGNPLDGLLAVAAAAGAQPGSEHSSGGFVAPSRAASEDLAPTRPTAIRPQAVLNGGAAFQPVAPAGGALPVVPGGAPLAGSAASLANPQPALSPSPQQLRAALVLYYQELQAFASTALLDYAGMPAAVLPPATARRLDQLVLTGLELVKLVLQAKGPGTQQLLQGGMAGVGPPGATSAADSLAQWQEVASRLFLTPVQARQVCAWREAYLQRLDHCYGERLMLKAQLAQDIAGPQAAAAAGADPAAAAATQPAWAEALLLQGAATAGYAAPALASVLLDDLLQKLAFNLEAEREMVCGMMEQLLTSILSRVQAVHFLLAGHPFAWNGLAFSHAVAMLHAG